MSDQVESVRLTDELGANVEYKCKHCGMLKGRHRSTDKACIIGRKRTNFPVFSNENTYAEDRRKPVKQKFTL